MEVYDHGGRWIQWKKNRPTASNMGGLWELQMRSSRSIMVALFNIHGPTLNDESLQSLLAEVEAIIKTRSITSES